MFINRLKYELKTHFKSPTFFIFFIIVILTYFTQYSQFNDRLYPPTEGSLDHYLTEATGADALSQGYNRLNTITNSKAVDAYPLPFDIPKSSHLSNSPQLKIMQPI